MRNMNFIAGPIRRTVLLPPNQYRNCLDYQRGLLESYRVSGIFDALCCPSLYAGQDPPWITPPSRSRRFQEQGSVVLSSLPAPGTQYTVHSFVVPTGMAGVLSLHYQMYTGAGFTEGSGDLIWRIRINRAYLRDYSNMLTSLGNNVSPMPFNRGVVRLKSLDRVDYIVELGTDAPAHLDFTARIATGMMGYYYPQE